MIYGALNWRSFNAEEVCKMTKEVYMIDISRNLDAELMNEIKEMNFSRVPLYYGDRDRNLVVGILMTRSLIGIAPNPDMKLIDLFRDDDTVDILTPAYIKPDAAVESVLEVFREGNVHQAIICDDIVDLTRETEAVSQYIMASDDQRDEKKELAEAIIAEDDQRKHNVIGIVTFENVLESVLDMDIKDEKDAEKIEK